LVSMMSLIWASSGRLPSPSPPVVLVRMYSYYAMVPPQPPEFITMQVLTRVMIPLALHWHASGALM
jgi:hypothetical protein